MDEEVEYKNPWGDDAAYNDIVERSVRVWQLYMSPHVLFVLCLFVLAAFPGSRLVFSWQPLVLCSIVLFVFCALYCRF